VTDEVKIQGMIRPSRRKVKDTRGRPPLPDGPTAQRLALAKAQAERLAILEEMGNITLTRDVIDHIEEQTYLGSYPAVVARSLGIQTGTFDNWMREGEKRWNQAVDNDDPTLLFTGSDPAALRVELYLRVGKADATLEVATVNALRSRIDAERHWQGYMTLLERRYPKRWAKRDPQSGGEQVSIEQRVAAYLRGAHDAQRQGNEFGLPSAGQTSGGS
jgi:hypothetical protein